MKKSIRAIYRWAMDRFYYREPVLYCARCGGCGEDPCCRVECCDGGFLCAGYYGDANNRAKILADRESSDSSPPSE